MKSKSKKVVLKPKYSGPLSVKFWKAINDRSGGVSHEEWDAKYALGCKLQNLEWEVLKIVNKK
jgi:hypothetical protein